jgi:hypothetical protein
MLYNDTLSSTKAILDLGESSVDNGAEVNGRGIVPAFSLSVWTKQRLTSRHNTNWLDQEPSRESPNN